MVAAVATDEPQMAPKAALASTAAMAIPPLKRRVIPAAKAKRAREMPPCVAKLPIKIKSGITERS